MGEKTIVDEKAKIDIKLAALLRPSDDIQLLSKSGHNPSITNNTFEEIWPPGGRYNWNPAETTMKVTSTDDTEDAPGGTGALTIEITYLDDTFTEKTEIVTMNGRTEVLTTATDIFRINHVRVKTGGSTNFNQGTIYVFDDASGSSGGTPTVDTDVYAIIPPGYAEDSQCIFTVPKDSTCFVMNYVHGASDDHKSMLFYREAGSTAWNRALLTQSNSNGIGNAGPIQPVPKKFDAGTDFMLTSGDNSGMVVDIGAAISILLTRAEKI